MLIVAQVKENRFTNIGGRRNLLTRGVINFGPTGGVINFGPTGGVGGGQTRKNFAARSAAKFFQTRSNARSAPKNLLIWVILTFSKYLDII